MESFKKEITYMSILTVFYCLLSGCDGNSRAFSKSEHLSESSEPNVQQFSNLYNTALKQCDSKDYESAISNLNNALDCVGIIFERDMVYSKLAEIYKIQNKPELELKYLNLILESIPKNAPPSKKRDELIQRAAHLQSILKDSWRTTQ